MERGLFSPLGTPTPLGSMGYGANLDTPEPGDTDLSSMDAHLRSIEAYEHTKLEQSVQVILLSARLPPHRASSYAFSPCCLPPTLTLPHLLFSCSDFFGTPTTLVQIYFQKNIRPTCLAPTVCTKFQKNKTLPPPRCTLAGHGQCPSKRNPGGNVARCLH